MWSLAFLSVSVAAYADAFFQVTAWSEFDPIVADGSERPFPEDLVLERALSEIQYAVSGMVYGYRFEYIPGDPSRDLAESFVMQPYATIPRGDSSLSVHQTWVDQNRLYVRVGYDVQAEQLAWFQGWRSGANERSTGVGTSSLFLGPGHKTEAIQDAVRHAVREHVRAQVFTRPRQINGAALLAESPQFAVVRGNYQATVDVLLQIDSVESFGTY